MKPVVLVVDDEPAIRELFKYVFEDAGHEVALANNGREALGALRGGSGENKVTRNLIRRAKI